MLKNPVVVFIIFCFFIPMATGATLATLGVSIKTSPIIFLVLFLPIIAISQMAYYHIMREIRKEK